MSRWIFAVVLGCLVAGQATANEAHRLTVSAGLTGVVLTENEAAEVRVEYRGPVQPLVWDLPFVAGLAPIVGGMVNSDESAYGYVALGLPITTADGRFELMPKAGIGVYEQGNSVDLASTAQFFLGVEASYALRSGHRVGIAWAHESNGGLKPRNPGLNSLLLSYAIPFGAIPLGR